MKLLKNAIVLAGALTLSASVLAEDVVETDEVSREVKELRGFVNNGFASDFGGKLLRHIELTQEQLEAIETGVADVYASMPAPGEVTMEEGIEAGVAAHLKVKELIESILTDEQKAELEAIKAEREAKRAEYEAEREAAWEEKQAEMEALTEEDIAAMEAEREARKADWEAKHAAMEELTEEDIAAMEAEREARKADWEAKHAAMEELTEEDIAAMEAEREARLAAWADRGERKCEESDESEDTTEEVTE